MIKQKISPNTNPLLFTIFIILIHSTLSDCPISYYPESTFIGSIKSIIDTSRSRIKQQQYSYNLIQPLTTNSPKVSIMISSFSYNCWGNINFKISYKPTPSFSRLVFSVNVVQQGSNKWQFVQYSFFASQNTIFQLGSQTIQSFSNTETQNKKMIISQLPIQQIYQKPSIKIFLNGLNVQGNITKQQVDSIKSQIDGYKALSYSSSVVRFLQRKLTERQTLQAQITNITLNIKNLTFYVDLGFKQTISFLTFSYIIFSSNQNYNKNQFIDGRFNISMDSSNMFTSLTHMDMFFIGLDSFKIKQWQPTNLHPTLNIDQLNLTFTVKDTFKQKSNYFLFNYFAVSRMKDNFCSHCRDGSIIYQNFCVSQCPQNYVKKSNSQGFYCQLCDIKLFKIPNKQKSQCVCASQYFSVASFKSASQFTCPACSYQCLTCQSEYKCLTCDNLYLNTFRSLDEKSQCVCAPGYYDDGMSNIKCSKCHQNCLTCRGSSQFQCQTCSKGRTKGPDGNCICDSNFVQKNGVCVCQSPNFSYKGYCFTYLSKNKCLQTQIQITINGQSRCQCKPTYQRYKTSCVLCGRNEKIDQNTGRCVCKQTAYLNQVTNKCQQCGSGKIYNEMLKKCVCLTGSFQNSSGVCVTCNRRQTLINNVCTCIYNYFKNDWGQCQRCQRQSKRPQCQINYR